MAKRRRLLLVIVAAVVLPLAGLGVYLALPPKPGVTRENFHRLRRGMLLEEVEAVFGSPGSPDEETPDDRILYWWDGGRGESACLVVNGNQVVLRGYYFDGQGRRLREMRGRPEDGTEILRRWVKERTGW